MHALSRYLHALSRGVRLRSKRRSMRARNPSQAARTWGLPYASRGWRLGVEIWLQGAATYGQPAGHNHYQLFAHLAQTMAAACGGAELHICDVGTNFGDSARAWVTGSPEAHVATFDLDDSPAKIAEVQRRMGGPASAHTAAGVREYYGPRVRFYRGNLVENKTLFRTCANSTLMLLDTAHYPETDPLELGFVPWRCTRRAIAASCSWTIRGWAGR